ncbi:MAG: hypothetical protein F4X48_00070 [Acidimicrobiia bacterium]|nr:hypothetical protein [Acidimicrobiia bacterium]MYC56976.1 hypothetical protein [Acidimicrobiia bacterium]MYI30841.1 hypothetical protein [Acidimicrobiia bacterium]
MLLEVAGWGFRGYCGVLWEKRGDTECPSGENVLTGEHRRSLDDKGRLSLPSPFRLALVDGAYVGIYKNCLGIWTATEANKALERFETAVRSGEASSDDQRWFAANLDFATVDAQGRLALPSSKRDKLGIGKQVALIGVFNRAEVWDAEQWQSLQDSMGNAEMDRWL